MGHTHRILWIEPLAPPKPAIGAPCNGCGVCCLFEPCPLGMLLSRRRRGACDALLWNQAAATYRCGVLDQPALMARSSLPKLLQSMASPLSWLFVRFARRWIAAGVGCDSTLQASPPATVPPPVTL